MLAGVSPLAQAARGVQVVPVPPADLFADGENGAWWSATDQFGVRLFNTALYADYGERSGVRAQVEILLDQASWDGGSLDDVLGSDLVSNGGFDTDTVWSKGTGWAITGGKAVRSSGTAGSANLSQACLTVGKTYLIEITIEAIATANLRILAGSGGTPCFIPTTATVPSTFRVVAKCAGSTTLFVQSVAANGTCTIDNVTAREIPGNHAIQATQANCPLYYAGGYLDHADGTDLLTAAFASDPGASTLVYSTISGVTISENVSTGTSYNLPTADWFDAVLVNRGMDADERAGLSLFLTQRRDAALEDAIATWGDSYSASTGVASQALGWDYLLQGKFTPARPRFNGGVGGATTADMLAALKANSYYRRALTIFWDKLNTSNETTAEWLANVAAAVEYIGHPRFVILAPVNTTGEGTGTAYYDDVIELNTALAATYPANYLDIRSYLIADGLTDAGITPTGDDTTAIAEDRIPPSLLNVDGVHLEAGQALVATQTYNFIAAKGW